MKEIIKRSAEKIKALQLNIEIKKQYLSLDCGGLYLLLQITSIDLFSDLPSERIGFRIL